MPSATLDRLLALLLAAIAATGFLSLRAGAPEEAWLFVLHGLLGGALLVAIAVKVRRTVPGGLRRAVPRRRFVAGLVVVVAGVSVVAGFASVATGQLVVIGPWTLISWHAVAGLALLPLLLLHLLPHRWRLLRPRFRRLPVRWPPFRLRQGRLHQAVHAPAVTRRSVLRGSGLALLAIGVVGSGAWVAAAALDRMAGGVRRFTGSRWLTPGGIPPVTTFFGEGTPAIDPAAWRLTVHGRVRRPGSYSLSELATLGVTEVSAVLDCTSGWAIETAWHGVPLGAVLAAAGVDPSATRIEVRAVSGWGAGLGMADVANALLATHVAGRPLPAGNGAPCRLVVDGRRGLDWVKWVTEIDVR